MRWVVYEEATGSIRRLINCPAQHAAQQAKAGEAVIPAPEPFNGNDETHKVVNGEVVEIS